MVCMSARRSSSSAPVSPVNRCVYNSAAGLNYPCITLWYTVARNKVTLPSPLLFPKGFMRTGCMPLGPADLAGFTLCRALRVLSAVTTSCQCQEPQRKYSRLEPYFKPYVQCGGTPMSLPIWSHLRQLCCRWRGSGSTSYLTALLDSTYLD